MEYVIQKHFDALMRMEKIILKTVLGDIKSLISRNDVIGNVASMLIHVVAQCACYNLSDEKKAVIELLSNLSDSNFLYKTVLELIDEETMIENHTFPCLLQDVIIILEQIQLHIPSSMTTVHFLGFVDRIRLKIVECSQAEIISDLLQRIVSLKDCILATITLRQKSLKSKSKLDEDNLRPPENFRTISVIPTEDDIVYPTSFLRKNKKKGEYQNLEHYLDVQFRLYREDCIAPLRDVFEEYVMKDRQQKRTFRLENGRIYRNITIERQTSASLEHGEVYTVVLDAAHVSRINWKNSKRLIYGSLLLLSFDRFKSIIFGVVSDSDHQLLQQGRFKLKIMRTKNDYHIPRNTVGIILEATAAYFESYVHVLSAIQSLNEDTFPFLKYIVDCQPEVDPPKYLSRSTDICYDIQPVISAIEGSPANNQPPSMYDSNNRKADIDEFKPIENVVIKPFDIFQPLPALPSSKEIKMDDSQRVAYLSALRNEFVLIQGPPGTGKTYIGLQIAKTLLHNKNVWKRSRQEEEEDKQESHVNDSLLIVCFSNHALDQFLEGIADFFPDKERKNKIVRMGNQSKNPVTENFLIKHHRRNVQVPSQHTAARVLRKVETTKQFILRNREMLKVFRSNTIVAKFHVIKHIIPDEYLVQFRDDPDSIWLDWLGVSIRSWFTAVKRRYKRHYKFRKKQFLNVVQDKEIGAEGNDFDQEYEERAIDEDQHFELNVSEVGIDLVTQYTYVIHNINDERCLDILTEEANSSLDGLGTSIKATKSFMNGKINIFNLSLQDRWKMYKYWIDEYIQHTQLQLQTKEQEYNEIFAEYKAAKLEVDRQILKRVSVIGMTTTYAARSNELLKTICPRITIIEEAAEVPEAHIISAINPKCEHVVLIGDHKQLEPKTAVRELAIRYNLSLSLFERMIENGLEYHCLQEQHRMRPEIADLVRHIYPILHDHSSVSEYENVKGVKTNLFFIDHSHEEQYNEDTRSYYNKHEATFLLSLFGYLLKQGYKSSEITILVAYTGQLLCMKEEMQRKGLRNIKISVLDNYQGEENNIILLSLVRSNTLGEIGFLNRENRICVALSRAKRGMYIIGNGTTLSKKSRQWCYVLEKLKNVAHRANLAKEESHFGKALPLYCGIHFDKAGIMAECESDFGRTPEGGCDKLCEFRLKCGHVCPYYCHPLDPNHETFRCKKICKKCCPNGHTCDAKCHYPDECSTCISKINRELSCGHMARMMCYENPTKYKCKEKILRTLKCGHTLLKECYIKLPDILCYQNIKDERPYCGHIFERPCHQIDYDKKEPCKEDVLKKFPDCLHQKLVPCFIDLISADKMEKVSIDDHKTVVCEEQIVKVLKCGHVISILCHTREFACQPCISLCDKECKYGHKCKRKCHFGIPCECPEIVEKSYPCGHRLNIECFIDPSSIPCDKMVKMILIRCLHTIELPCFEKTKYQTAESNFEKEVILRNFLCKEKVTVELKECEHRTETECWKRYKLLADSSNTFLDIKCDALVDHKLSKCGHIVQVPCWKKKCFVEKQTHKYNRRYLSKISESSIVCSLLVERDLFSCGHKQMVKCGDRTGAKCEENVAYIYPACGHKNDIKCWQKQIIMTQRQRQSAYMLKDFNLPPCQFGYDTYFVCGHSRTISCEENCHASLHGEKGILSCKSCKVNDLQIVNKTLCFKNLLCGHKCPSAGYLNCLPCSDQCTFTCGHSSCDKPCIETCKPCQEPCCWICPHQKCTRMCFEQCDRTLCNNDCPNLLKCGHRCPGFCGEPCSMWCTECHPQNIIGLKDSKRDKVVQLRECLHCFESNTLDECIDRDNSSLLTCCPECKAVIHNHPRYYLHLKKKKILFERVKAEIRTLAENKIQSFSFVDVRNVPEFIDYVLKFQTFIQITIHTKQKGVGGLQVETLQYLADNTLKLVKYAKQLPINDIELWSSISDQIFKMQVYWILCLLDSDENIAFKTLRVTTESTPSTSLGSNNECKSQTDEHHDSAVKLFNVEDFIKHVLDKLACNEKEEVEEYLELLSMVLSNDEYVYYAMNVPKLKTGSTIHENDWKICPNGHFLPAVFSDRCESCDIGLPPLTDFRLTSVPTKPLNINNPNPKPTINNAEKKDGLRGSFQNKKTISKVNQQYHENYVKSNNKPPYATRRDTEFKSWDNKTRYKSNSTKVEKTIIFHKTTRSNTSTSHTPRLDTAEPSPQELKRGNNNFLQEHFKRHDNVSFSRPNWRTNREEKNDNKSDRRHSNNYKKTVKKTDSEQVDTNPPVDSTALRDQQRNPTTTSRGRRKTRWKRII